MNKKILSIIVIIGLISSTNAAAGDAIACADPAVGATFGIQKCSQNAADNGPNTPSATAGAANCLAGYRFVYGTDVHTSKCVACLGNQWQAAETDTTAASDRTATSTCTDCSAGLVAAAGSNEAADCAPCAVGSALNTDTKACVVIPTTGTNTGIVAGGRVYTTTTAAATTFTLVSCDQTNGYQETKSGTNTCVECPNRATSGCATCETLATCTACRSVGFRKTSADGVTPVVCAACTGECAECNSTGTNGAEVCTKAKDGSYLTTAGVVTKCPDNATKCTWDATLTPPAVRVTAVAAGYFIKTGAVSVATLCPEGKSSAANDTAASDGVAVCSISCASNCVSCTTALAGKCDQCQDDYYIADAAQTDATKFCVKFDDTTRPATCQTASANDAMSCTSCSAEQFRERDPAAPTTDTKFKCTCQAGYTDVSNVAAPATKSPICKKCGTGVKNCDAGQPIVCTNAAEQVAGENCYATTAAAGSIQGFFYDAATSAFKVCDTTCLTCAGGDATKCVTCAQITVDTTQLTEQDVTTLSAAWSNGTYTATAPGTCYAKCPEGYQTDPAVRTACEMASFGNILSAIVLISFIILMF